MQLVHAGEAGQLLNAKMGQSGSIERANQPSYPLKAMVYSVVLAYEKNWSIKVKSVA